MPTKYWLSVTIALSLFVSAGVLWVSQNTKIAQSSSLSCIYPQHVFVGGTAYVWCEGPSSSSEAFVTGLTTRKLWPVYGTAGPVRFSSRRADGSRCPELDSCFRFLYKGLHPTPKSHGDTVAVRLYGQSMDFGYVGHIAVVKDQF